MWTLKLQNDNDQDPIQIYYLFGISKAYSVGRRQNSDNQNNVITLKDDKSVSREHATIYLDSNGHLSIEDLSSTYGTYLLKKNGSLKQLPSKIKHSISSGNLVRFGALNNIWQITSMELATCTSTCKLNEETLSIMQSMGVDVLPNWSEDCTHLTMSSITITLKVLSSLVAARPIVKPEFWKDFYDALLANSGLPDAKNYLPLVQEPTLNLQTANFHPNTSRSKVFQNRNFYFITRSQLNKYNNIIIAASGKTELINFSKMKKPNLCTANNIVIQCMDEELSHETHATKVAVTDIIQHLSRNDCRIIPESEIGLAILSNSLQKFCNPKFRFAAEILKSPTNTNNSMNRNIEIYALETEPFAALPTQTDQCDNPFISPSSNKYEQDKADNSNKSNETNSSTNSSLNIKLNRKSKRNQSPDPLEPPSKKIVDSCELNTLKLSRTKNKKKRESSDDDEVIFNFETSSNKPGNSYDSSQNITLHVKLNAKSKKAKFSNSSNADENDDVFNFLPTVTEEIPKESFEKSKKIFFCDTVDAIDRKRICLVEEHSSSKKPSCDISETKVNFVSKCNTLENTRWISSKEPSLNSLIKKEDIDIEEKSKDQLIEKEIENKMEELNLKPAIIIIKNNLIVRNTTVDKTLNSTMNEEKSNFKKFVKVKPLKPQTEIISRSNFMIYENESSKLSKSSGLQKMLEEDEDECDISLLLDNKKKPRNNFRTSRRL